MFDALSNPLAPMALLVFIAGLAAGFMWGNRYRAGMIGDDLDMMGRFRNGPWLFEGRCVGHVDEDDSRFDDEDDDAGEPRTVEELLNDIQKNGRHPDQHRDAPARG